MSAFWDERYQSPDYVFGTEPNIFLKEIQHLLPKSGKALDLATGEGRNAIFLAQCGLTVEGIDTSIIALQKAQRLAQSKNVHVDFRIADITTEDFPTLYYDLISSVFFHLRKPERNQIFKKINDSLRPNGLFVGVFYHPDQRILGTGGPSDPAMFADLAEIQTSLSNLEWLHAEHRIHNLEEGTRHSGKSSVLYLLGRKLSAE